VEVGASRNKSVIDIRPKHSQVNRLKIHPLTLRGLLVVVPLKSRVLRRGATAAFPLSFLVIPPLAIGLDDMTGWERRPGDEKILANFRAGRARAFFEVSSIVSLDGLDATVSVLFCRIVDRSLFCAGPVSSAEDSGRAAG
jgi:hypothetical protein